MLIILSWIFIISFSFFNDGSTIIASQFLLLTTFKVLSSLYPSTLIGIVLFFIIRNLLPWIPISRDFFAICFNVSLNSMQKLLDFSSSPYVHGSSTTQALYPLIVISAAQVPFLS